MRVCGGGCKLDFRLILASNWGHDTGRGSSQHLRTLKKVPANKVLFAGTVPANNLFVINKKFKTRAVHHVHTINKKKIQIQYF